MRPWSTTAQQSLPSKLPFFSSSPASSLLIRPTSNGYTVSLELWASTTSPCYSSRCSSVVQSQCSGALQPMANASISEFSFLSITSSVFSATSLSFFYPVLSPRNSKSDLSQSSRSSLSLELEESPASLALFG